LPEYGVISHKIELSAVMDFAFLHISTRLDSSASVAMGYWLDRSASVAMGYGLED
jgi:hypothetical protein